MARAVARNAGILWSSLACLTGALVFYVLAVTGSFFEKPVPPTDIGLYGVTAVLVTFGLAGLFLRWAKLRASTAD